MGLEVVSGVPAGVEDDDDVGPGNVEAHAPGPGRDEEEEDVRVGVELLDQVLPRLRPEVGFLNILLLFHTTLRPNKGITLDK